MTTDEQLAKVEKEVKDLNGKVDTILQLVQKMDVGLYGDMKNKYIGVIDRQSQLENEIEEIREQILLIISKNSEQEITLKTKKSTKAELIDDAKEIGKWVIKVIVACLVLKGLINPEALLQH